MTYKEALKASLLQAAIFAALFMGMMMMGDYLWERQVDWLEKLITVGIGFVIFWLLMAFRVKGRNS